MSSVILTVGHTTVNGATPKWWATLQWRAKDIATASGTLQWQTDRSHEGRNNTLQYLTVDALPNGSPSTCGRYRKRCNKVPCTLSWINHDVVLRTLESPYNLLTWSGRTILLRLYVPFKLPLSPRTRSRLSPRKSRHVWMKILRSPKILVSLHYLGNLVVMASAVSVWHRPESIRKTTATPCRRWNWIHPAVQVTQGRQLFIRNLTHQRRSRISIYQVQMLVNPRHRGCSHTLITSNNSTPHGYQYATPTPQQFHSGPSGHSYTFPSSNSST